MPKLVTVYTTRGCPHCIRAKDLLKRKGISFQEMDITDKADEREKLEKRYGWMTVPIIVIGDKFIGGAEELYAFDRKGELEAIINK